MPIARAVILSKDQETARKAAIALFQHLEQGVPTGVFSALPSSHQWSPNPGKDTEHLPLQEREGNRKAAEEEPALLDALLQDEIDEGWVMQVPGGEEEARTKCHRSICHVNPRCHLLERVILPCAADVRLAFHALDELGQFTAASIDFKAAQKQIRVLPSEL